MACDLGESNVVRVAVDGGEFSESRAKISLSEKGGGIYKAYLMSKAERIVVGWDVRNKDPAKWVGNRYRAHRMRVDEPSVKFSFENDNVGVIVEITDVEGRVVSGRFSGYAGVGAGSHQISNGTFRAPVIFWKR